MTMRHFCAFLAALCLVAFCTTASADPLPGQQLKFLQSPLNLGVLPPLGVPYPPGYPTTGAPYPGHDELSTAYLGPNPNGTAGIYRGTFMADDFADFRNDPVVHVQWWGSYMNPNAANPPAQVQKFLIAWESDIPANTGGVTYSRPGNLLQQPEIVTFTNAALPAAGQFTEKLVSPAGHPEPVYQYNAELSIPFPEKAGNVYWLKIVALDDNHTSPSDPGALQWGWHNRDWSINDPLAWNPSSLPAIAPPGGEHIQGFLPGNQPVWHFQDDAVSGQFVWDLGQPLSQGFQQLSPIPQHYLDATDGPSGIGQWSKDLAFALYTIPEPSSMILLALGAVGLIVAGVRRRNK